MKKREMFHIVILVCSIMMVFSGCNLSGNEEPGEDTYTLTNVFNPTPYDIPKGYVYQDYVGSSENTLFFCITKTVYDKETQTYTARETAIYSVNTDTGEGEIISEYQGYAETAVIHNEETVLMFHDWQETDIYWIEKWHNQTMLYKSGNVLELADTEKFCSPTQLTADDAGNIYINCVGQIVVLDTTLTEAYYISDEIYSSVSSGSTGNVWVSFLDAGTQKMVIAPIEHETKSIGEIVTVSGEGTINDIWAGDKTYDLYYVNDSAYYGYQTDTGVSTCLMNYYNSNLETGAVIKPIHENQVIMEGIKNGAAVPIVYDKGNDITYDRDDILTIYTVALNTRYLDSTVRAYNQSNPEKRLVVVNYQHNELESHMYTSEDRLAMDIETGLVKPDIYCGTPDDAPFRLLLEKDRFVDLTPYMTADDTVNFDNLFGIVTNSCVSDGKIFALPCELRFATLYISKKHLMETYENEWEYNWGLDDIFDIDAKLNDEQMLFAESTQTYFLNQLFGGTGYGYNNFIDWDTYTCSFDSENFYKLLRYIRELPMEAERISNDAELIRNGDIVMTIGIGNTTDMNKYMVSDMYYPDGDMVRIGYPTKDGKNGTILSPYTNMMMITGSCSDPEAAWKLVKTFVREGISSLKGFVPVLKDQFIDAVPVADAGKGFFLTVSGQVLTCKLDNIGEDGTYRGMAGQLVEFTDELIDTTFDFLDHIGEPMERVIVPEDIIKIIQEEISVFLSGTYTEEKCAEMIQSRVALYLNEVQ